MLADCRQLLPDIVFNNPINYTNITPFILERRSRVLINYWSIVWLNKSQHRLAYCYRSNCKCNACRPSGSVWSFSIVCDQSFPQNNSLSRYNFPSSFVITHPVSRCRTIIKYKHVSRVRLNVDLYYVFIFSVWASSKHAYLQQLKGYATCCCMGHLVRYFDRCIIYSLVNRHSSVQRTIGL